MRHASPAAATGQRDSGSSAPMLTRVGAATYLSVSLRTLDRLVRSGSITAYRIGGHRRFRIEDIDRYVTRSAE